MAVESFTELLHKLKDIHEQELEGLQQKVQELTNKKNCDAKRLEELYNRNQQLREQHKMLTENIKQLENMLRAGLCDRCTVTQEMAKKRQQDYESSHLQSLQHISILMGEISALMKDNERLREEVKTLRGRIEQQNGHHDEVKPPELKQSPDSAVRPPSLSTSALQNDHAPLGVATLSPITVKTECERSQSTEALDKGSENVPLQGRNATSPFESSKPTPLVPSQVMWKGRRASSMESLDPRQSPTSPLIPPHLRLLKNNPLFSSRHSEERPAAVSIPLRPHPIKTALTALPWALPEQTDWVTAVNAGTSGIIVHPNLKSNSSPTIIRFPSLVSSGLESLPPARSPIHSHSICPTPTPKSLFEVTDSKIKRTAPSSWSSSQSERIFGENLREGAIESPLDLSSAGSSKIKETETDSSSSSSSSPPAPLSSPSSAQYASSPPSDPQTGDPKTEMKGQHSHRGTPGVYHMTTDPAPQSEEQRDSGDFGEIEETKERHKENGDEEKKKIESAYTENLKVPTLTISLRPVVVLETLKAAEQKEQKTEQDSYAQDQQDEEESKQSVVRKRSSQTPEAPLRRSLKEKRMRMTLAPQGPSHGDTEQG